MRCRGPYRTSCWRKRHTSHSAAQAQWREDDRVRSRTTTLGERRSMAEYTIVSVADVPDQAAEVGMDPEHFEIRFLGESLGLRNFSVTFERFGGGWQPPQDTRTGAGTGTRSRKRSTSSCRAARKASSTA